MKINNISNTNNKNIQFKGLKNAGVVQGRLTNAQNDFIGIRTNLLVQLTDDFEGKDLSDFYNSIKKCEQKVHIPKFCKDKNFIYITADKLENYLPILSVNGQIVPAINETTPLYTFLAKVTRNLIKKATKSELVVNNDFKYGPEASEYLNPFNQVPGTIPVEFAFNPKNTQIASHVINDSIDFIMRDFLA